MTRIQDIPADAPPAPPERSTLERLQEIAREIEERPTPPPFRQRNENGAMIFERSPEPAAA